MASDPHPLQKYLDGLPPDIQQQFLALANAGTGAVSSGQPGQSPQDRYDPTDGMSTTDRVMAGIGRGMVNIGRHAANLVGLESDQDLAAAQRLDAPLLNTTAGKVGNFVGETAATLPAMGGAELALGKLGAGALLRAAGSGAAQGVLTADPGQRLQGAAVGAGAGTILPGATAALGKVARGFTRTPEAQALINAGVDRVTPGQMNPTGGLSRMEQTLSETPVVGGMLKNARRAPMNQY